MEIIASVATPKTEQAWIDDALRHGYAEPRAAAAHEVYERARAALGPGGTHAGAFEKLCEMALGAAEEGAPPGGDSAKAAPRARPSPYTVVVHVDPEGIYLLEDGPDGRTIRQPVAPEDLARILGLGARVVGVPPIALEGEVKTIAFGERGSVPEEERAPRLSAEERELLLLREGLRCFACGSRDDLTIAHLVARAKGGRSDVRLEPFTLVGATSEAGACVFRSSRTANPVQSEHGFRRIPNADSGGRRTGTARSPGSRADRLRARPGARARRDPARAFPMPLRIAADLGGSRGISRRLGASRGISADPVPAGPATLPPGTEASFGLP